MTALQFHYLMLIITAVSSFSLHLVHKKTKEIFPEFMAIILMFAALYHFFAVMGGFFFDGGVEEVNQGIQERIYKFWH